MGCLLGLSGLRRCGATTTCREVSRKEKALKVQLEAVKEKEKANKAQKWEEEQKRCITKGSFC